MEEVPSIVIARRVEVELGCHLSPAAPSQLAPCATALRARGRGRRLTSDPAMGDDSGTGELVPRALDAADSVK
jgi:hypothetical protein